MFLPGIEQESCACFDARNHLVPLQQSPHPFEFCWQIVRKRIEAMMIDGDGNRPITDLVHQFQRLVPSVSRQAVRVVAKFHSRTRHLNLRDPERAEASAQVSAGDSL